MNNSTANDIIQQCRRTASSDDRSPSGPSRKITAKNLKIVLLSK